jgi:signal peptidase
VALRVVVAVACLALVIFGLGPRTGAYRTLTVLSGSMQPLFGAGDVVVVTPEPARDLRVGQVIAYRIPVGDHHVETHRVIRILKHGRYPVIRTKGDANPIRDPWTARLSQPTVWHQRWVIPYVGYLMIWLREPTMRTMLVVLTPLLLAIVWLFEIWRPDDDPDESVAGAA